LTSLLGCPEEAIQLDCSNNHLCLEAIKHRKPKVEYEIIAGNNLFNRSKSSSDSQDFRKIAEDMQKRWKNVGKLLRKFKYKTFLGASKLRKKNAGYKKTIEELTQKAERLEMNLNIEQIEKYALNAQSEGERAKPQTPPTERLRNYDQTDPDFFGGSLVDFASLAEEERTQKLQDKAQIQQLKASEAKIGSQIENLR
jgi:hypothetical protein